jgi:hypothetical protein
MVRKQSVNQKGESADTPVLIKAYGEFWSPDVVNWDRTWRLLGTNSQGQLINVYEQRGVYVLYNDFDPVYVGRGDRSSIGWRLQQHRESRRKGPRWDRFSWFGMNGIRKNGELAALTKVTHSTTSELIATLEALLIMVVDPRLNARREKLKNAILLYQSEEDKPLEADERLSLIERKLDSVLKIKQHN